MKLEQQVTSLKLSKRLKELGVKQDSLFSWVKPKDKDVWVCWYYKELCRDEVKDWDDISAFTVAELGEKLPKEHQFYSYPMVLDGKDAWDCTSDNKNLFADEGWEIGQSGMPPMFAKSEANARAKMLVYLIKNKIIK